MGLSQKENWLEESKEETTITLKGRKEGIGENQDEVDWKITTAPGGDPS